MDILKSYALSFVGVRYNYGGDDPIAGFDCSGFVQELLKSCGVIPHMTQKMNAQMLYNLLESNASQNKYGCGSIAFFGKDATHITHVGFCLDQYRMIEAGGGDSNTTNEAAAIASNAFIRVRPIRYRKDFLCVLKPNYATIGLV